MIPMLTSILYNAKHESKRIATMSCDESFAKDVPNERKVWNILKKRGFTTGLSAPCANHMMGCKKCSWNGEFDHEAPIMGCQPDGSNPWKCIGCPSSSKTVDCKLHDLGKAYVNKRGKNVNELSLEWVEALWRTVDGSKFVYNHIDSPHDDVSKVSQLDEDLLRHLKHMAKHEKTVTILMGDHGPPHGAGGLQSVPLLSFILSDDLAKAGAGGGMWDGFRGALQSNQHRLVSHIDLYETLLHLSDLSSKSDPASPAGSEPRSLLRYVSPRLRLLEQGRAPRVGGGEEVDTNLRSFLDPLNRW